MACTLSQWQRKIRNNMFDSRIIGTGHVKFFLKLATVCSTALLAGCSTEDPQHYIEEGKVLFEKGEMESARVQFQNAIQLDPKLTDAYFRLALLDENKQNWAGMLRNLQEALALDPRHLQAQLKLGQVYLVGGQLDKATEQANIALQLSPDDSMGLLLQGAVRFRRGQLADAMQTVERVLAKQPAPPEALGLQANILLAGQQVDAARAVLQTGIERNPAHADLRLLKIKLEIDNRQFETAIQDYRALIAQHPENTAAQVALANLLSEVGRPDEAESVLRAAMDQQPANTELKLKWLDLSERQHAQHIETSLQAFIAQFPDDASFKFRLVEYYLQHQRPADAESLLHALIDADGEASEQLAAKIKLADIALARNDDAQVEALAKEVLSVDPSNSEALLLRARLHLNKQDADAAIADLRIVRQNQGKSEQVLLLLALAESLKGQAEVAESLWRQVLEINPNNMVAIIDLTNQLLKRGDYARAEALSVKAIQANPNDPAPLEMLIQLKAAQKDWRAAQKGVEQLKTLSQTALAAKYWEGFLAARQGHVQTAIKAYQEAFAVKPDHVQTLEALRQVYQDSGRRAELLAYLKKFVTQNPSVTPAQLLLAQAYSRDKDWAAAEAALSRAGENLPDDMDIKLKLVEVIARRDEARAETTLKSFIQTHPKQAALRFRLASLYIARQQYSEAVAALQEIVGLDPANKEGLTAKLKLAELAWIRKDPGMAHTLLAEVIAHDALHSEALMLRASMYLSDKNADSAIADLRQVLDKRPDYEPALLMLVQAYQKQPGQQELIEYLKSLLLKKPRLDTIYPLLTAAYAKDQRWDEAEKLLRDKLTFDANYVPAYVMLARIYADQGRDADAEAVYREGAAAVGENPQLLAARAGFLLARQDFDKAITVYEAMVKKFPDNDEAANNLAELLITRRAGDKKSIARALVLVERFKDSANASILDTYGWVHVKADDVETALPALTRAARSGAQDAAVHYHLGVALQQHGDNRAAIAELEQALALAKQQGAFFEIDKAAALLEKLRNN